MIRANRRQQAADRLAAWDRWQDHGLVFPSKVGTPRDPDHIDRTWHKVRAAAGLDWLRLHDLRHACATFLLVFGASPRTVMKVLGHIQIGLTMNTYAHVLPEVERPAVDEAAKQLFGRLRCTEAVVIDSWGSDKRPTWGDGGAPGRIRTCGLAISRRSERAGRGAVLLLSPSVTVGCRRRWLAVWAVRMAVRHAAADHLIRRFPRPCLSRPMPSAWSWSSSARQLDRSRPVRSSPPRWLPSVAPRLSAWESDKIGSGYRVPPG
ncbi:tyrosine-type recombinase/integrase [Micromonospora rhizosphaerae]|uniref:tyrosine-type recombinase/integrase n=1 Tax=Micromonospora rhizosphaerae TaxID=568872 RepID=UPI000B886081